VWSKILSFSTKETAKAFSAELVRLCRKQTNFATAERLLANLRETGSEVQKR
jgi:hypothetical protein